jgi:uroporphyrin-III C-methyltransferase
MGKVFLVGAGPGAADLLTVRATRILAKADIVFHDALVQAEVLALAGHARIVPVGKRCSQVSTDQRFINRNLVEAAARYETVVRLKGGDPMIFGRAQEEIDALVHAGVPFEVVPGITAALGASAELGVSLTRRGLSRSVVFVTPRIGEDQTAENSRWAQAACAADTAILYMSRGDASVLTATLRAAGLRAEHPVAIVEGASLRDTRRIYCTLSELPIRVAQTRGGPVLVILGEVLSESLQATREHAVAAPAARCAV